MVDRCVWCGVSKGKTGSTEIVAEIAASLMCANTVTTSGQKGGNGFKEGSQDNDFSSTPLAANEKQFCISSKQTTSSTSNF